MQRTTILITLIVMIIASTVTSAVGVEADSRLSKPVTITASDVRLHTVIEQISKSTEVDIRCGKDSKDWEVRDIPVIVCVKDMPLGKLLQAIADSTHLGLTVKYPEADNKGKDPIYRIYRDKKSRDDLYAGWDQQCQLISWEWNALAALGKIPDLDDLTYNNPNYGFKEKRNALAKLVASLPADTVQRIMDGETIHLSTKNARAPIQELYGTLRDFSFDPESVAETISQYEKMGLPDYRIESEREFLKDLQTPLNEAPEADIDQATVTLKLINSSVAMPQVQISVFPIIRDKMFFMWADTLLGTQTGWGYAPRPDEIPELRLPQKPASSAETDLWPLGCDLRDNKLHFFGSASKQEEWERSVLATKLHLELPKDKGLTYGDIMAAIGEASGFNIVMEDFKSHVQTANFGFGPKATLAFKTDLTLGEALKELNEETKQFWAGVVSEWWWSLNENEKTIIGCDWTWRKHHFNLVPESLLISIGKKANNEGLDLDDVTPLLSLRAGQQKEWINSNSLFGFGLTTDQPLWQLYDKLTPREKSLAKSDAGLALMQVGIERLGSILNEINRNSRYMGPARQWRLGGGDLAQKCLKEELCRNLALSDPEFASKLTLRVYKSNRRGIDYYKAEIKGESNGDEFVITDNDSFFFVSFPIYSDKRKAELKEIEKPMK